MDDEQKVREALLALTDLVKGGVNLYRYMKERKERDGTDTELARWADRFCDWWREIKPLMDTLPMDKL